MARNLSRRALWLNRLSDEVVRGLSERIQSGSLEQGAPLPDREALMAEFVTSSGVIDRAIETLEADGLATRDAEGVLRVAPPARHELDIPLAEARTRSDVVAILELRIGIEAEAAALAAERRTDAQLTAIREAQAALGEAAQADSGVAQADFLFHLAIAEATGNHYLCDLTEYLGPLLIPRMRMRLKPSEGTDTNLAAAQAEHRAIVDAIDASDPVAARQAMRQHLTRSLELVRGLDATFELPGAESPHTPGEHE